MADGSRSIGDVARELDISVHALRLYERRDLLVAPVRRDASGRRRYSDDDVEWLQRLVQLRGWADVIAQKMAYYQGVVEGEAGECQVPASSPGNLAGAGGQ